MRTPTGELAGEELRTMRLSLGLSQTDVANAWGRPQPNLSQIELNKRRVSAEQKQLLIAVMKHLYRERAVK